MYSCELEPTLREYDIPHGHLGIEWTIDHMDTIAVAGARAPIVLEEAREIVGASTGAAAAEKIRAFIAGNVAFEFDPPGVELIRTPELLLTHIRCRGGAVGDCDDVAVLGAALGMAVGFTATYVLVGFHPTDPFEHVYTELATDTGPVELDTTRPAHLPPELEIRRVERREVIMYEGAGYSADPTGPGLAGFWGDLGGGLLDAAPGVIGGGSEPVSGPIPDDAPWWQGGLEAVTTAAGEWAAGEIGGVPQSTSPWGPGYTGQLPPLAPAPVIQASPAPAMSPLVNGLILGGLVLGGLKLAKVF